MHYIFQHMSTIIKVTQDVTLLSEYYITDRRKYESTKGYTGMNSINGAHEFTEAKLERRAGDLEGWALDSLPMIHATTAHL